MKSTNFTKQKKPAELQMSLNACLQSWWERRHAAEGYQTVQQLLGLNVIFLITWSYSVFEIEINIYHIIFRIKTRTHGAFIYWKYYNFKATLKKKKAVLRAKAEYNQGHFYMTWRLPHHWTYSLFNHANINNKLLNINLQWSTEHSLYFTQ